MKTMLVAVCGVEADGKLPLIKFKRNYLTGYWGLPGGKFDDGEFLPDTAVREIAEELGLAVSFEKFHGVVDELAVVDGETVRAVLFVVSAKPSAEPDFDRQENDEGIIEWFTPEEIAAKEPEVVPSDFRIIQDILLGGQTGYWKCQQTITGGKPVLDFFDRT